MHGSWRLPKNILGTDIINRKPSVPDFTGGGRSKDPPPQIPCRSSGCALPPPCAAYRLAPRGGGLTPTWLVNN
jgi:hypothetical protein